MAESTATPDKAKPVRKPRTPRVKAAGDGSALETAALKGEAKAKFAKALEEAKAGTQALGKQAQATAGAYREKISDKSDALIDDARQVTDQAKEKAAALATEGKAKAVEGLSAAARLVAENAGTLDEKLGPKAGDYARTAAKSMQDAAEKLDSKDLAELGEDAREMVRKSPGLAVGLAAAAGFLLARLFKGSNKSEG